MGGAGSLAQLRGSLVQFQKALTLQCLQSRLPGAQALRQHVLRLLDLGLQAAAVLSSPQVRSRTRPGSARACHASKLGWSELVWPRCWPAWEWTVIWHVRLLRGRDPGSEPSAGPKHSKHDSSMHPAWGLCSSRCRQLCLNPGAMQEDAAAAAAQLHGLQVRWRDGVRAVQNFANRPFEIVRAVQLPELMLQLDLNGFYQRLAAL